MTNILNKVNDKLKEKAHRLAQDVDHKTEVTSEAQVRLEAGKQTLTALLDSNVNAIRDKAAELQNQGNEVVGKISRVMAEAAPQLRRDPGRVRDAISQLDDAANELRSGVGDVARVAGRVEASMSRLLDGANIPVDVIPRNLVSDLVEDQRTHGRSGQTPTDTASDPRRSRQAPVGVDRKRNGPPAQTATTNPSGAVANLGRRGLGLVFGRASSLVPHEPSHTVQQGGGAASDPMQAASGAIGQITGAAADRDMTGLLGQLTGAANATAEGTMRIAEFREGRRGVQIAGEDGKAREAFYRDLTGAERARFEDAYEQLNGDANEDHHNRPEQDATAPRGEADGNDGAATGSESEAEASGFGAGEGGTGDGGRAARRSSSRQAPRTATTTTPTPAAPATITHIPQHAAMEGADDRTTVGVGERVNFTSTASGTWTATAAKAGTARTARGRRFSWYAPATAAGVTITFDPGGGAATQATAMTVIQPSEVDFIIPGARTFPNGTMGAGMITQVRFKPFTVDFSATSWKESPGPGVHPTGYFEGRRLPYHHPTRRWLPISEGNGGPTDNASFWGFPAPWTAGTFRWEIPNKYRVDGESGAGHDITTIIQTCTLQGGSAAGTTTVTKGNSSVTRAPGATPARRRATGRRARGEGDDAGAATGEGSVGSGKNESEAPDLATAAKPSGATSSLPHLDRMEAAFGMDFGDVRVRLGAGEEMNELGARALTQGNQITFASTNPDPELIAHELTHVVQQRRSGSANAAPKAIEQGERDALEGEAQSIGKRVKAGAPVGPILGITQGAALREDDPHAKDVLPPPTLLQVLGDRFKLTYRRGTENRLFCDVHYEGELKTDGPFIKNNTQELGEILSDKQRKLNAKVVKVTTTSVTVDAYGDGLTLATFEVKSSPDTGSRKHFFSWKIAGHPFGASITMWIKVPEEPAAPEPKKPGGPGTGDVKQTGKSSLTFTAVDSFTLTATRFGDSQSVAVSLSGGAGVMNPSAQSFEIPVEGPLDKVAPKILTSDGRNIEFDLTGDGKVDLKLVHTVRSMSKSPDNKSEIRDHHFRRFDKDGVLVGTYKGGMLYAFSGPVKTIPKEQNEDTNAPNVNTEAPVTRPPAQSDEIGELPEAINAPGDVIEMRIDGDGDRTKELLVRFKALPPQNASDQKGQIRIDIIQVSTAFYRTHTFDTTADAAKHIKPWMVEVADGKNPTVVQVMSSVHSDYGTTLNMKLSPPMIDEATKQRTYTMDFAGRSITYAFPEEAAATNSLVKKSDALANTGNVARFEVVLGEFGDKFWVMHEAQPGGAEVFSVAAVGTNGPVAARGVPLIGGSAGVTSFSQVNAGPTNFAIDTNKDGKPDIQLFDALSAPVFSGKHKAPLKDERDHRITVSGPVIAGGDQKWHFIVRGGQFQQAMFDGGGDRQAAAAASSVQTLSEQQSDSQTKDENGKVTKEGDVKTLLSRIAGQLTANRQKAMSAGLITPKLYSAWHDLSQQLITLGPQIGASKVDPAVQEAAAKNADTFYAEFAAATTSEIDVSHSGGKATSTTTITNKYTATKSRHGSYNTTIDGPGIRLPGEIRSGKWPQVTTDFDALVRGLDRWIGAKQKSGSEAEQQQKYLVGMQDSMKEIKEKPGMVRVMASFQPDAGYNTNTKKWGEIPLMLFAWKEDGKWWLKDITNPARKAFLDRVPAKDGETHPPSEIFQALDYARHFPKGAIHYQIPGGPGGQIRTTERKEWYEFLQWVGLGLAVVGFSLASMGTGTVVATAAAVAFAGAGLASAVYAIGDLEARARHGDLEPFAVVMNIAQIVAGIFSAGAVISGRIVAAAAQADIAAAQGVKGAAAWTGAAARIASIAQKAYIPALGTAAAADAVNLLALGADTISQIATIREGAGSTADKMAAISQLIAQGLALGSITIFSIRGDMPAIFSGKPTIVVDIVHGIPIARANHLAIAGTKINATGGADAQATARWQSHGIEEAAAEGNKAAQGLLKDTAFMGAYRKWMGQAEPKVRFVDGKPKPNFAKGAEPSPEMQKRIQDFIDTKGVDISLYEKAWGHAAEFRKVDDVVAKAGGADVGTGAWKDARPTIVKALGGDKAADALVARYERFRLGENAANPAAYRAERDHLRKLIPDTEVDTIKGVFPEHEVYITGGATQTGKTLNPNIADIDVVVVVPKGTPPEVMAAIEARARGVTVRPDPGFLQANGIDPNKTLPLDVKVMTPDQFFGFTGASAGGAKSSQLNFTRVDDGAVSARKWADKLAATHPKPMTPDEVTADTAEYLKRKSTVEGMYEQAMKGEIATPSGVSKERLELAVKGDADSGQRVPLTYGTDPVKAKQVFDELKADLKAVLDSEGITDAVIVQLGSGTTGWSTAPGKTGKAWTPKSDVDFAIFSDQALIQAQRAGAPINPKNQQSGKYTTLKNSVDGAKGFYDTPLGAKLKDLAEKWNQRIYGATDVDGFDFKLNLSDKPFASAVPVVALEMPVPLTQGANGTRAIPIDGRSKYFGVPVSEPKMAGRIPEKTTGRREYHITVLSPPEYAKLSPESKALVDAGVDIPGAPRGRSMQRSNIGDAHAFTMEVEWPEAQAFRASLTNADGTKLGPKDLHVSLNGGIGDAVKARDAAKVPGNE